MNDVSPSGQTDDPDPAKAPDGVWYDSPAAFVVHGAINGLVTAGLLTIPWAAPFAALTGITALWSVVRAAWRTPRIRITADGIIDETFWYSGGLIRWEAIRDVRPTRWGLLQIELFDENTYWESLHPLKTLALIKMQLYGFSPIVITPWGLEGSRRALVAELQDGLDRWAVEAAGRGELAGPTLDDA